MSKARLVGTVLVVAGLAPFAAADEADRADTIAAIDAKVQAIGADLVGLAAAPDANHVSEAVAAAIEVRELIATLDKVKGDSDRAADMVAHYPRYIDAFLRVAPELVTLKRDQHRADGVVERCAKDEAALQVTLQQSKATDDLEHVIAKLSARGDETGRKWTGVLHELADLDREVTTATAAARLALTDSYWMDVSAKVNQAATAIASEWSDSYHATTAGCEQLALGANHPDLARLVIDLGKRAGAAESAVTQLVHDYNAWLQQLRALRELAEKHREAVRSAICTASDDERDERAGNVADQWARDMNDGYDAALARSQQVRALAAEAAIRKYKAPQLVTTGLKVNLAIAAKLKAHELLGRHNPSLRTTLTSIHQRHEDLLKGCAYKHVDLKPGDCNATACQLQCVKVEKNTCDVVEVTASSDQAKNAGFAHGDVFAQALHAWYVRDKKELLAKYPAVRGCENSNRTDLNLTNEVVTFDACSKLAADELGEALPAVSSDLGDAD